METITSPDTLQPIIWTIGHSNVSLDRFIELLEDADIKTVIDCRSTPRSRWPHFNADRLGDSLTNVSMYYEPRGYNLGGLGKNVDFAETLDELAARASEGERIALLCSEGDPKKCHRTTLLAPELEARDVRIEHLLYAKNPLNRA